MSVTAYPNMPDADYYSHPAMSQSKLKAWVKGEEPKGRFLLVGDAVHKAVLEGRASVDHHYGTEDERDKGIQTPEGFVEPNLATKRGQTPPRGVGKETPRQGVPETGRAARRPGLRPGPCEATPRSGRCSSPATSCGRWPSSARSTS